MIKFWSLDKSSFYYFDEEISLQIMNSDHIKSIPTNLMDYLSMNEVDMLVKINNLLDLTFEVIEKEFNINENLKKENSEIFYKEKKELKENLSNCILLILKEMKLEVYQCVYDTLSVVSIQSEFDYIDNKSDIIFEICKSFFPEADISKLKPKT